MVTLNLRLHKPRRVYLRRDGELYFQIWFEGVSIDDEEIAINGPDGTEYTKSYTVTFDESSNSSSGQLKFSPRWTDPDSKQVFPGTVSAILPIQRNVLLLVSEDIPNEHGIFLQLDLSSESHAISHIGPHGAGEWIWDSTRTNPLQASITSVGVAPLPPLPHSDPLPNKHSALTEVAGKLDAIRETLLAHELLLRRLQAPLHRIVLMLLLIFLSVVALIYAIVRVT